MKWRRIVTSNEFRCDQNVYTVTELLANSREAFAADVADYADSELRWTSGLGKG